MDRNHQTDRLANISAIKLALLARQAHAQAEGAEMIDAEPIAIIGLGCRFPGGANDPQRFWQLLASGGDAISRVPPDRWDADAFYDPDPSKAGKMTTRWGGFIDQVDGFDPGFFEISPREAARMDPQQRLVLEVAYEALEDASQTREKTSGSMTGVYIASYHNDYARLLTTSPEDVDAYSSTGTAHSIVANRLSFLLNLRGPSLAVDTACSSSLVAVHLACQALRHGECGMALAGGVSLILTPETTVSLSKWGFMAEDGRCKTFDDGANGFVRGEGCGIMVLKRLSDALLSGDPILALIRGSAVNQDGRSTVLTAPNGQAQEAVIRQAIANAHVGPDQITYIEAHGTGTVLGDPIEVEALSEIFKGGQACALASVKTNIGHLEAAAGIAGLIKVILAMQHRAIPAHLHLKKLNKHISLEGTPFYIPTELRSWESGSGPRLAGISSFGFGGTNAHVVLEEAPEIPIERDGKAWRTYLLPVSAHQPEALRALAEAYQSALRPLEGDALYDAVYKASRGRTQAGFRLAVTGKTGSELATNLQTRLASGITPSSAPNSDVQVGFVFSGQGPQWWAMGRSLLEHEPVFRAEIEKIDRLLQPLTGWSLLEELSNPEAKSRLNETQVAQPAIFALQMGLSALWQAWGVRPAAVVGHSIGEVSAACVAGVLTLEQAVEVVYHRSWLMQQATGLGKMASVEMNLDRAERLIQDYGDRLSIAAINSPNHIVLSGETQALEQVLQELEQQGTAFRRLSVDYAFHSAQMSPFVAQLVQRLDGLSPRNGNLPVYSTVTGDQLDGQAWQAAYWGKNMRQPVRFALAIANMAKQRVNTFLEISPHPVLSAMIERCLQAEEGFRKVIYSLRRGKDDDEMLLTALGELYSLGIDPRWEVLYPGRSGYVHLPTLPWQRERYWIDTGNRRKNRTEIPTDQLVHDLLGRELTSPAISGRLFESYLYASTLPYLADHRIYDFVLLPATAYIEMALSAAGQQAQIENLNFLQALPLDEQDARRIQFHLAEEQSDRREFRVYSQSGDTWNLHAQGLIRNAESDGQEIVDLESIRARLGAEIPIETHYARVRETGLQFGPAFQCLTRIWRGEGEALGQVELPEILAEDPGPGMGKHPYVFHPALLDACLQTVSEALPETALAEVFLPVSIASFRLHQRPGRALVSYARLDPGATAGAEMLESEVIVCDSAGNLVAEIQGILLKRTSMAALRSVLSTHPNQDLFYRINWQAKPISETRSLSPARWLVFSGTDGTGAELAARLEQQGHSCSLIFPGEKWRILSDTEIQLNPASAEDFQTLLGHLLQNGEQSIAGICYLWSLDIPSPDEDRSLSADQALSLGGALKLVQSLGRQNSAGLPPVYWVTRAAQPVLDRDRIAAEQAPIGGFVNTLIIENPNIKSIYVDLDPGSSPGEAAGDLASEIACSDNEDQVAYRQGQRYVARLARFDPLSQAHPATMPGVHLTIPTRGTFDNLALQPSPRPRPGAGQVTVQVRAAGLNFRDVLNALGLYPGDPGPLGDEFAGVIVAVGEGVTQFAPGQAVMGLASGSFGSYVATHTQLIVPKPASLSFEEAATIPIAFLTAYYALHKLAGLSAGQSVLIHAASGGVGMAATQIAQWLGAEIFATAGSPEKRSLLQSLHIAHIMNSRTLDFSQEVLRQTGGQGVDVVLNSLAGEFIPKSLAALKPDGHFLEIGKTGIWSPEAVRQVRPAADYSVIFLGDLIQNQPEVIQAMLEELMALFSQGVLTPLPHQVFPLERAEDAFRFMAQARHVGKNVIQIPEPQERPAFRISPDKAYLVSGGLGGIGRHIARWLASQGARHLALAGRSGAATPQAQQLVAELEQAGVQVCVYAADFSQSEAVSGVLAEIENTLPALGGVIHAAGIVEDGVLQQQDWDRFARVLSPKMDAAWALHRLTQAMPLDFFVTFSSAAAILGSAGQSSYAAANAFLDSLAQYRHRQAMPSLSVNWGAWDNTGMTAALSEQDRRRIYQQGFNALSPEQALASLETVLHTQESQVAILSIDWERYLAQSSRLERPFYSAFAEATRNTISKKAEPANKSELLQRWPDIPAARRPGVLQSYLREEAIRILSLPANQAIDPRQPLNALGLNSLMAVEMRNALNLNLACTLPATLLFDYPTLDALSRYLMDSVPALREEKPAMDSESKAAPIKPDQGAPIDGLDQLTDEEAEALLLEELESLRKRI